MSLEIIIFLLWNAAVFFVYGVDKLLAIKHKRRISEKTLILLAFLLGSAGAALGMLCFRHKTRKLKFKIAIPLAVASNFAFIKIMLFMF